MTQNTSATVLLIAPSKGDAGHVSSDLFYAICSNIRTVEFSLLIEQRQNQGSHPIGAQYIESLASKL